MRDILTVLAAILIVILTAAVVAPPFLPWESYRSEIDRAISRAAGLTARTEGAIEVRLLPLPRIRLETLHLNGAGAGPNLRADDVSAEFQLSPMLRGEVRFTETRIGRADVHIPITGAGVWHLPGGGLSQAHPLAREVAVESLRVDQLLVTTHVPATGRTDQLYAENVAIEGQTLAGPWRLEGTTSGLPFRLVTGTLGEDRSLSVKLSGGGDTAPRFDIDGRLAFEPLASGGVTMGVNGKAKILFGPPAQVAAAGIPIPVAIDATFRTEESVLQLEAVSLEAGEGGASVRLAGTGRVDLAEPRIALKLAGRRLDADSFLLSASGREFIQRVGRWAPPPVRVPIDLDLSLDSIGFAQEEFTEVVARLSLEQGRVEVERFSFAGPGETTVLVTGDAGLTTEGGMNGGISLSSKASDRLARTLARIGVRNPILEFLDGRPVEASADILVGAQVTSLRNLRLRAGDAVLTGNARIEPGTSGARGRLEAQVAIRALDLAQLPRVSSLFEATENLDVSIVLEARDVSYGQQRGAGRITARIASDGPALRVETLEIVDLAGANARVSGRILPDGSGRIAGKVTAQRAAPLVDLIGSVWIGGVSKLVPHFLREGALDLDILTERAVPQPGSSELRLRTTARGRAAGGGFDGEVYTVDGLTERLDLRLATENTGTWVGRPDTPALRRASSVTLTGSRVPSGHFHLSVSGDIGGVRVTTTRPFALSVGDDVVESGEAQFATADVTPFLVLLGDGAGVKPPVPVDLRITLGRERDTNLITAEGRVAGEAVQARVTARSRSDFSGSLALDRLSAPWMVSALALNAPPGPSSNAVWSSARFGQSGRLLTGGQVQMRVRQFELGRGLTVQNAGFSLALTGEGLGIRDLTASLGDGILTGSFNVTRQGSQASLLGEGAVRDIPLAVLAGEAPFEARFSASLRFGSSGESTAALVANLGGSGELHLHNVKVPNADPAALGRSLERLLADDDPLAIGRAETVVKEELARGDLVAGPTTVPGSIIGGSLRLSPVSLDASDGSWQGAITFDLRSLTFESRGTLVGRSAPKRWTGAPPSVSISWKGTLAEPRRELDISSLANGLAAIVLQRELERVEAFEADANERRRRQQRLDYERQRAKELQAFEEAQREARLREEAERARAEAERARIEAARLEAEQRARQDAARRAAEEAERARRETNGPQAGQSEPSALPSLPPPVEIPRAPAIQIHP
ncbi:AsmA family protein [Microvirga massiliensis]|uniref:AsmA family protein n=1 Tax=Microvirga massiliensis TaxID=1033741 RepID=UPI000660CA48|nr:AsmA family protein [Microvirga massiliensis]